MKTSHNLSSDNGPDRDFWPDLAEVDLEPIRPQIVDLLSDAAAEEVVPAEEDWLWLQYYLAHYLAQERFRALMPDALEVRRLTGVQHAAARMLNHLDALSKNGADERYLPDTYLRERRAVHSALKVLSSSSPWVIEYPPAAPLLDHQLRQLWQRLTGKRAGVRKDGGQNSKYYAFFTCVLGALPSNELPYETVATAAQRPKQYRMQLAKQAAALRRREELLRLTAEKIAGLTAVG